MPHEGCDKLSASAGIGKPPDSAGEHLFQLRHAFHLRQHSSNSSFAASSDPARLSVRRFSGREVGWRIEHVGRPRSGVHRVTCPTCAGEDGEQELPPMYDPREDLGR